MWVVLVCNNARNSEFLVIPLILLQFIERILMNNEPFLGICCCVDVSLLSFRDDTVVFMLVDCIIAMTGCLWAPARQPRWVGRWSATPASHPALQAALFRRVFLQGRRRSKHSAVNVIMRDGYTALSTMVAHDRISMSVVTQVQAENFKRHEFTKMRIYTCREIRSIVDSMLS